MLLDGVTLCAIATLSPSLQGHSTSLRLAGLPSMNSWVPITAICPRPRHSGLSPLHTHEHLSHPPLSHALASLSLPMSSPVTYALRLTWGQRTSSQGGSGRRGKGAPASSPTVTCTLTWRKRLRTLKCRHRRVHRLSSAGRLLRNESSQGSVRLAVSGLGRSPRPAQLDMSSAEALGVRGGVRVFGE